MADYKVVSQSFTQSVNPTVSGYKTVDEQIEEFLNGPVVSGWTLESMDLIGGDTSKAKYQFVFSK